MRTLTPAAALVAAASLGLALPSMTAPAQAGISLSLTFSSGVSYYDPCVYPTYSYYDPCRVACYDPCYDPCDDVCFAPASSVSFGFRISTPVVYHRSSGWHGWYPYGYYVAPVKSVRFYDDCYDPCAPVIIHPRPVYYGGYHAPFWRTGSYRRGFGHGYGKGFNNGFNSGFDQGYGSGFDDGYGSGYGDGYSDGSNGLPPAVERSPLEPMPAGVYGPGLPRRLAAPEAPASPGGELGERERDRDRGVAPSRGGPSSGSRATPNRNVRPQGPAAPVGLGPRRNDPPRASFQGDGLAAGVPVAAPAPATVPAPGPVKPVDADDPDARSAVKAPVPSGFAGGSGGSAPMSMPEARRAASGRNAVSVPGAAPAGSSGAGRSEASGERGVRTRGAPPAPSRPLPPRADRAGGEVPRAQFGGDGGASSSSGVGAGGRAGSRSPVMGPSSVPAPAPSPRRAPTRVPMADDGAGSAFTPMVDASRPAAGAAPSRASASRAGASSRSSRAEAPLPRGQSVMGPATPTGSSRSPSASSASRGSRGSAAAPAMPRGQSVPRGSAGGEARSTGGRSAFGAGGPSASRAAASRGAASPASRGGRGAAPATPPSQAAPPPASFGGN